MCENVHVSADASEARRGCQISRNWVVSCPMWIQGYELRSFRGAVHFLNHPLTPPAPDNFISMI